MIPRRLGACLYLLVAALACDRAREGAPVNSAPAAAPSDSSAAGEMARSGAATQSSARNRDARVIGEAIGFRSLERLDEHFRKHGREFGTITRDEYLRQAQTLRDAAVGRNILQLRRSDGSFARFDRRSLGFLAFDADGVILTYFKPNAGESYFRRQARRRGTP